MTFRHSLQGLILYVLLAIAFNLCWLLAKYGFGMDFITNGKIFSSLLLLQIMWLVIWLGHRQHYMTFALAMVFMTILLMLGGIWPHIARWLKGELSSYANMLVFWWALLNNLFGVVVSLAAIGLALSQKRAASRAAWPCFDN